MYAVMFSLFINSVVIGVWALFSCAIGPVARIIPAAKRVSLCLLFSVLLLLPMGILQAVAPISIELANPTMLVESPFASYRDDEDGVPGTSEQAPLTGMDAGEQQTNVNSRVFYRFNMFTLATMPHR